MFSLLLLSIIGVLYVNGQNQFTLKGEKTVDSDHHEAVTLEVSPSTNIAQITMTGKSSEWMGVGWGGHSMDHTYAICADGEGTGVSEWTLGDNKRGTQLRKTITVQSDTVSNGVRTVVVTRNTTVTGSQYYNFPEKAEQIEIIWAYGPSDQAIYNKSTEMGGHGETTLNLGQAISMPFPFKNKLKRLLPKKLH
eukprot:298851_1